MRSQVRLFALLILTTMVATAFNRPAIAQQPAADAPPAAAEQPAAEGNPKELLEKGEAALKAGEFPTALAAFSEADRLASQAGGIEALRDHFAALTGRGRALAGMKETTTAIEDFTTVLTDEPKYVPALLARGQVYLDIGRVEDAQIDYQKAAQTDMSNAEAQFGLGKTLVLLGKADEAIGPLTRAIAADPKNGEAYRMRGQANTALFKLKAGLEDLQQAITIDPNDYEAYFMLGALHYRAEDFPGAIEQFTKSIEHYKPKPGQEELPYLQGYLTRANAWIDLAKITKDPEKQKAAFKAAYDDAQQLVSQLDAKNPMHVRALATCLFSRGVAERMLGDLGTAIRSFTKAIELRAGSGADDSTAPFLSDTYFRRGICFHLIGEDKMAISDFEASAHLAYGDPRANLWEGFTYAKMGDYQNALRAYGDAIAASDRYTPAYYNRALAYMMLGDYHKSVIDFNDAIRLDPTNAEYYYKRGVAYEQLADNKKASESFAAALQFDNKHAGAYRHMADAVQKLGHSELSKQYRDRANQLAPPKKSP